MMGGSELHRQVREKVCTAFYDLIETLHPLSLVLMLDTCEWLNEPECQEIGQWMLQSVLPEMRERLYEKHRDCVAVLASRFSLDLAAINGQERRQRVLHMLDKAAVYDYLSRVGIQDTALHQRVYDLTHGHALCVSIIATLWQEQPFSLADLPTLQGQFAKSRTSRSNLSMKTHSGYPSQGPFFVN